ncbi:MAG: putative serine protease PepD [Pseudonocardiales bacterium]|nr:putative serine protease PepD [Pseudonocardiales bacterium]
MTELRTDIDVRSRASGEQRRFVAGHVVSLKRDPAADFPLRHETTSRRAHAELSWSDGHGWVLRDVSARAGLFLGGVAQQAVLIDRPTLVRLGATDAGEDLELTPVGTVDPAHAARMAALSAQTVMAPQAGAGAAWRLAVTAAGETLTFEHEPVGRAVSIGRDPACDVTVDDATVSRHHADLVSTPEGWRYEDHSTGGSWLDGKRKATVTVDRTTELKLGEPLTGVPLRLEVSAPADVVRRRERRIRSVKLAAAAGAVAVIAVVATVVALVAGNGSDSNQTPNTISSATLLAVEQATVKLEIIGADGESAGWGSGSIIDPHGMILTNSHVADPNALGLTTQYGSPLGDETPAYLLVDLRGDGPDGTVQARYRARKVVSDGYLDLAVVQIYADAKGNKIDPATLNLPTLEVGDSDKLSVGDEVTVVGFPGVSQSRAATVTKGDASAFVRDERLKSDRSWIETTARIAHGNSGGAAVDASGALIGVPTRIAPEHEGDVGWWFRPVDWANRLITLARNHQGSGYVTPYVTPATGVTITPLGWTANKDDACGTDPSQQVAHAAGGTFEMYLGVRVAGLQKGLEFNVSISGPAGYSSDTTGTSSGTASACFTVPVIFRNGDGRYYVQLSVDPPGSSTEYAAIAVGGS